MAERLIISFSFKQEYCYKLVWSLVLFSFFENNEKNLQGHFFFSFPNSNLKKKEGTI